MNEARSDRPATTTDAGIPVASQEHSLTVGPDGPVLLQDFYLIEQKGTSIASASPNASPTPREAGPSEYSR
jgi:catalase